MKLPQIYLIGFHPFRMIALHVI